MGSRTLPTDCEHGVTVDWGDFGPCQDCKDHDWSDECPNFVDCPDCTAMKRLQATADAEQRVLDAVENWRTKPDSPGAMLRLMQEAQAWVDTKETPT